MCTAFIFSHYLGRTLDLERTYGEEVTVTPRNFPLPFRHLPPLTHHHAIIGMAHVEENYPLYYDAVNEHGLAMAGLNFEGFACYAPPAKGKENVAHFELIPHMLGRCSDMAQARQLLHDLHITDTPFSPTYPPARLHWLLTDGKDTLVIEPLKDGLQLWENSVGVLTNDPPFDGQLLHLSHYPTLSPTMPKSRFPLPVPFRGLGSAHLPGALTSPARFVRCAFTRAHAQTGKTEAETLQQVFHIASSVSQVRGCSLLPDGSAVSTQYSACINLCKGTYYYTTYSRRRITAVELHRENLESAALRRYPLHQKEDIAYQN